MPTIIHLGIEQDKINDNMPEIILFRCQMASKDLNEHLF